jgi:predicted RNase H-like HicB family nuclease
MTCDLWIRQREDGFVVTVPGLPGFVIEAATRDQAVEKARAEIRSLLASGELVRIDLGDIPEAKARGVGIFADVDDETWNQFLAAMKEYRDQLDTDPNAF